MKISCHSCGQHLEIDESHLASSLNCPTCGALIDATRTPRLDDSSPTAASGKPRAQWKKIAILSLVLNLLFALGAALVAVALFLTATSGVLGPVFCNLLTSAGYSITRVSRVILEEDLYSNAVSVGGDVAVFGVQDVRAAARGRDANLRSVQIDVTDTNNKVIYSERVYCTTAPSGASGVEYKLRDGTTNAVFLRVKK